MRGLAIASVLLIASANGAQAAEHEVFAALGVDAAVSPELSSPGILLLHYRARDLVGDVDFDLQYNTDTLRLVASDLCFGAVCLGAQLSGELRFAGLMPYYFQQGQRIDERGFDAGWLSGGVFAKVGTGKTFVRYAADVRHWFFSAAEEGFVLPEETTVFEQQLNLTYWDLEHDPSLSDPHRFVPRIRGFAIGVDAQVDLRRRVKPWGAPGTERNDPQIFSSFVRQWAWIGTQLHDRVRIQVMQESFFSSGLDDLNRRRVGGLNPYVTPVAGLPWAAFVVDQLYGASGSAHLRVWEQVEAGVRVDAAAVQDPFRVGDTDFGAAIGAAAFVDAPLGPFWVHLSGGYALPQNWQLEKPHVSVFGAVGAQIW